MHSVKYNSKTRYLIIFFLFASLLFARRWTQLIDPQVWNEDGTVFIPQYLEYGWFFLFKPVAGYLIFVSKVITGLSLSISFYFYPYISTFLSWLFIILVGFAVIFSPTKLKGKIFCAISVFLIPSDPEVFGIPLYTFWWTAILLFLVVLWDQRDKNIKWRIIYLLLGGLSSPAILIIAPIMWVKAVLLKYSRNDTILAVVTTLLAILQLFFISKESAAHIQSLFSILSETIPTFFGMFMLGNLYLNGIELFGYILFFLILFWVYIEKNNVSSILLFLLLLASVVAVVFRIDPSVIHPALAGPRYFFFPFILLSWILIQMIYIKSNIALRVLSFTAVSIVLINLIPVINRKNTDNLNWSYHVIKCGEEEDYSIPIQFDGNKNTAWEVSISREKCESQIDSDIIFHMLK